MLHGAPLPHNCPAGHHQRAAVPLLQPGVQPLAAAHHRQPPLGGSSHGLRKQRRQQQRRQQQQRQERQGMTWQRQLSLARACRRHAAAHRTLYNTRPLHFWAPTSRRDCLPCAAAKSVASQRAARRHRPTPPLQPLPALCAAGRCPCTAFATRNELTRRQQAVGTVHFTALRTSWGW